LFDLRHRNRTRPAFGSNRFGQQLASAQKGLCLSGFCAFRVDLQGVVDQLNSFLHVAGALHEAGNSDIFGDCPGLVIEFFVGKSEARVSQYMLGVKGCNMHPVLDGFIDIALVKEKIGGAKCRFNCFF
jgi:hypothetical protein